MRHLAEYASERVDKYAISRKIDSFSHDFEIDPSVYCSDPYRKSFSGGSDSHMGVFAGLTGTQLYVPNLEERLRSESRVS